MLRVGPALIASLGLFVENVRIAESEQHACLGEPKKHRSVGG
jgi:hypothetical protein